MTAKINKEKCVGCNICVDLCPEGLSIGDDGKPTIINGDADCLPEAAKNCPQKAIKIN